MQKIAYFLLLNAGLGIAFAATMPAQTTTTTTTTSNTPMSTTTTPMSATTNLQLPPIKPKSNATQIMIPSITINNSSGAHIEATGVNWASSYDVKSAVENHFKFGLDLKTLKVTNTPFPVDGALNANLTMDNINIETLYKIIAILQAAKSAPTNSPQQNMALDEVAKLLPFTVTNATNIHLTDTFTAAQGDLVKDFKLSYPNNAPLPKTPDELMQHIQASVYIKIAIPLFDNFVNQMSSSLQNSIKAKPQASPSSNEMSPEIMQNMFSVLVAKFLNDAIQRGLVVKTETHYIFNATQENGVLKINGKTMDQFKGPSPSPFPGGTVNPNPGMMPQTPAPMPQTPTG